MSTNKGSPTKELERFASNCNSSIPATCHIIVGTDDNRQRITLPTWLFYLLC